MSEAACSPVSGEPAPILGPGIEFSVGVDTEEISRFAGMPESTLRALLGEEELKGSAEFALPAARLAGTWCAKEAVVKALWPWVQLDPRRVLVQRDEDGRPHAHVSGWDASDAGVTVRVAISHSGSVATAFALAWGPTPTVVALPEASA